MYFVCKRIKRRIRGSINVIRHFNEIARFTKAKRLERQIAHYTSDRKAKMISHVPREKLKKIGAKLRAIVIRALGSQLFRWNVSSK